MAFFKTLKRKISGQNKALDSAFLLYRALVEEARGPALYKNFDIPDTIDGRFDAIVLYISLFLVATRDVLEGKGGQDLVGVFLKDMDRNLREIGVGDLSVGKQVKKMAAGFYGRLKAYQAALEGKNPERALTAALTRNLYRDENAARAKGLARHSLGVYRRMQKLSFEEIIAGQTGGQGR